MVAIITDKIKKQLAQSLLDENEGVLIGDSDNYYYVGVGHSQQWDPEGNTDVASTPIASDREEKLFRYNLQSIKAVEAFSFVVPLYDWSANTVYAAYNDNIAGQPATSFYIRSSDNNVYVCIRTGKNAQGTVQVSTVQPDHTDLTLPIETDGYVWKYLYTISTADGNKFLTSSFMPVKFVDSAALLDPDFQQYTVQNNAVAGQIVGYRVTDGGGVYSSPPTITVNGNGSGAQARAILNTTGAISAVEVGDSTNAPLTPNMGTNYTYASVNVGTATLSSGGTSATIVPIFGPKNGLGGNATDDLRTTSIMFNIKPEGTVDDTWIVGNDYRQIGVLKNPTVYGDSAQFTDTQGIALNRMVLTTLPGANQINYETDVEITGVTSNAKAWLNYYDDSNTLWYHQDEYTGFTSFQNGENLNVEGYTASTLTIDSALLPPDIDIFSGDLLYIDNRATATTRDAGQTEDIKVVIKL